MLVNFTVKVAQLKNVIITGSNGMIGNLVLHDCLNRDDVKQVTSLSRKPLGIVHPKLKEVIHNDFMDYSNIEDTLKNQDLCFFCIGVYTGKVSKEEFKKITVDVTKIFATVLKRNSPNADFCFLSGQGADQAEKSKVMFAREKGIAENILLGLHFPHTYIFRPGYIYPVTPRKEPHFGYTFMRIIYPLVKPFPNASVTSIQLATKMVEIGLNGGNKIVYENKDIRG